MDNKENTPNEELLPFGSLALKKEVVEVLKEHSFLYMSPIQAKAIPPLLRGESIIGLAPTGTGKTLSYALPIINTLKNDGHVQAIILSPTVALLSQVRNVFTAFTKRLGYPEDAVKLIRSQDDFTHASPLVVLTTPAMLSGLTSHYPVNELSRIILDEGDMIVFDGFSEDLPLLKNAKEKKIISFFSASLGTQDLTRVKRLFGIQKVIDVREKEITSDSVSHHLLAHRGMEKKTALVSFLKLTQRSKTIVFVSTKKDLFALDEDLKKEGVKHLLLHGDLDKRVIDRTLSEFRKDTSDLLLASDYASRGIDVPTVERIISVDLPKDLDYYFHRSGRAGRFLSSGESFVLYDEDNDDDVSKVRSLIRRGVSFDLYKLSSNGLSKGKAKYQFKNLGKKDQSNALLQKQIRHAVNKTKSRKVKPNYKKKVSRAVEKVKEKHRMKVVRTNIARNGGNAADFHIDYTHQRRKKKSK